MASRCSVEITYRGRRRKICYMFLWAAKRISTAAVGSISEVPRYRGAEVTAVKHIAAVATG